MGMFWRLYAIDKIYDISIILLCILYRFGCVEHDKIWYESTSVLFVFQDNAFFCNRKHEKIRWEFTIFIYGRTYTYVHMEGRNLLTKHHSKKFILGFNCVSVCHRYTV